MSDICITEAISPKEREKFLQFPWQLYRHDPLWIPPLLPDLRARIDPRRGRFFKRGEANFYMAWRGRELVGTIMAAVDRTLNHDTGKNQAIFGFFEYHDAAVAQALCTRAETWARERGLDSLYGPFNLDYEDAYGVLLEGRDRPPTLLCGHSCEWYPATMDAMGFVPARGENIALELPLDPPHPDLIRMGTLAERIKARNGYRVRGADFKHIDDEIDRVHSLLNRSLCHLDDFLPYDRDSVVQMIEPFVQIADPELILFAEDGDETIGFFPGVPNLHEGFKSLDGLRNPLAWLQLPFLLKKKFSCLCIKSVLVPPEHWGDGVALLLFAEMYKRLEGSSYRWVDLSLTSTDNPNTPELAMRFGARVYKRYQVYRKVLN